MYSIKSLSTVRQQLANECLYQAIQGNLRTATRAKERVPVSPLWRSMQKKLRLVQVHVAPGLNGGGVGIADVSASPGALYIKRSLEVGEVVRHEEGSVVVLGDVPLGCTVDAGGDVIVLGQLLGVVSAPKDATVIALKMKASALTLGPVEASGTKLVSNTAQQVTAADGVLRFAPAFPDVLPPAAPGVDVGLLSGRVLVAAVVLLGLWLTLTPASVLGGYFHAGNEEMTGALVETVVYGYILLQGARLLSSGSELLLEILDPGIIGGVVLPVLGALPDSLIILASGLNVSREQAQQSLSVGIGTLAGSSILLLSLTWGASLLLGRCDLDDQGRAINKKLTRGWDLVNTGVTTDGEVGKGAAVMAFTLLLYGIVQVPAFLGDTEDPLAAAIGAGACLVAAVGYCVYQVVYPELQRRKIEAAKKKRFRLFAMRALALQSDQRQLGSLVTAGGELDRATVDKIFNEFDTDGTGTIDSHEMQALLVGLSLGTSDPPEGMDMLLQEFDVNSDKSITRDEFYNALAKWSKEHLSGRLTGLVSSPTSADLLRALSAGDSAALRSTAAELAAREQAAEEELEEEEATGPLSSGQILLQAMLKLGSGVALCALFSDPLVEALGNVSESTGIPPFFVGFVLTPIASNASEVLSSLSFAARKRSKNISLTFSQVYGAVTMNNTLVLGLFLWVVYKQQLSWVYSSEVAVIVAGTLFMAVIGSTRTTFRSWWAIPAIALYPASIATVWCLDTYLGWQ